MYLLFAFLLITQMFLPYAAKADVENGEDGISLVSLEQQNEKASETNEFTFKLKAHIKNSEKELKTEVIKVSDNFSLQKIAEGNIVDQANKVIGTYEVKENHLIVDLPGEVDKDVTFDVLAKYVKADASKDKDTIDFSSNSNHLSKEVSLYQEKEVETKPETKEKAPDVTKEPEKKASSEQTPQPPVEKPKQKAALLDEPQDVKDIFASLGYSEADSTILTGMELTYFDADGNPVEEPTVDDYVHFKFTWAIPNDVAAEINAGDYYTFTLPDTVKVTQNQTIALDPYANVEVNTNGTIKFVFTDAVHEHSNVHGTLEFDTQLNAEDIDGPGDITIKIPFEDNIPPVDVNVKPAVDSTIEKSGHFDKEFNPDFIYWQVDINKALDTIDHAVVNENFPTGTTYQSVKVYKVKVDLYGEVYPGSEELVTSGYTVDSAGNVTFTTPIQDAYRLEYTTKIDEDAKPENGGNKTFENTATLDADGTELPAKASVASAYGKLLNKQSSNYNPETQTSEWTVKYNYGEKNIAKEDATLYDEFSDSRMKLVEDSVQLNVVTFNADGSEVLGRQLVSGVDYKIELTSNGFDIIFLHDINYAVKIKYQTTLTGIIDDNVTVNNSIHTDTGDNSNSSGGIVQQNVIKTVGTADYDAKEVAWQIDVNKNHYWMENWQMTDQLSPGLTLLPDTFVMKDMVTGGTLVENQDYSLVYDEPSRQFTVKFLNTYQVRTDHDFRITYKTSFNTSVDGIDDPNRTFPNNGTTTWTDESGDTHSSSDGATFDPNDSAKYDGFKNGSYNATTSRITWEIGVNYDSKELENATLVDPIIGNQQFVPGSVKIYHYTVNPDGSIQKGDEIDNYGDFTIIEPSEINNETLTVRFPDEESAAYIVEFKTSLNGEIIEPTYDNDAAFTNGDAAPHHLTAEVSVQNGGDFVNKSGYQDEEGFAHWSITVNPSGSTLNDVVVTDHPSSNQAIDKNSIVVYRTVVKPDGSIVKNPYLPLKEGTDYSVSITTDPSTGEQELQIAFLHQIKSPYIIEYRSFVFISNAPEQKLTNDVTVNGNNEVTINDGADTTVDVVVLNGSGTAVGETGGISFQKVNGDGEPLTGAKFRLWNKDKTIALREGTVNANGELTFGNLPYGDYILQEVEAPEGYTISDELANGKVVTINEETTAATTPIELVNNPNRVILQKENETGDPLVGAEFKLEQNIGGTWTAIRTDEEFTTDLNGQLEILGLLPGDYRLTEIYAPEGYILNTEPVAFTVSKTAEGQIPDITLGPFINYTGSIEAVKQSESGEILPGAIFEVRDSSQNLVKRVVTDRSGHIAIDNLAPGDYSLTEVRAPRGYIKNTDPVLFTIPDEFAGDPGVMELDPLVNYKGTVELVKKNDSGNTLAGATFDLYKEDGTIVEQNLTTNQSGEIEVANLSPGKYYFMETKAPKGYQLNATKIPFEIVNEAAGKPERIELTAVNEAEENVPPITPPSGHGGETSQNGGPDSSDPLTTSSAGSDVQANKLPETGDSNATLWLILTGILLASLGGMMILRDATRKNN